MNTEATLVKNTQDQLPTLMDGFGFFAHPGTLNEYLSFVSGHIERREPVSVFYHNQHTLYGYFTNERLRQCFQNTTVIADGMCVIFLFKLSGYTLSRTHRLTYVDLIMPLLHLANNRGWRVFHLGQEPAVLERALDTIRQRVPGLDITGHDGYFDQTANSQDSRQVIEKINDHSTDLLLIGFGTPNQEYWVDAHRTAINAPVVMTCGACMEYVAGAVRTPPRWMGRLGLEWSFRMLENPRRFAYRYTVQTTKLAAILIKNWFTHRASKSTDA